MNKKLLDNFKNILNKEGLKLTPQRSAVLEEVLKDKGHRECEDIYFALKKQGKNVSRATLYRTMDILVENNFARKMDVGDGKARYENKIGSPHHDHLICISCGIIIEFVNPKIEDLQKKIATENKFILTRHILQLFGTCHNCS